MHGYISKKSMYTYVMEGKFKSIFLQTHPTSGKLCEKCLVLPKVVEASKVPDVYTKIAETQYLNNPTWL